MTKKDLTKIAQAEEILAQYWGATGFLKDKQALREALESLKLKKSDFIELRERLPEAGSGPSGDRVRSAGRLLERAAQ